MINKNMYMNSENLKVLANKLNEKINSIEDCYSEIKNCVEQVDGSSDSWKGNNQEKFYNYATSLSKDFPTNIDKFKEFYTFLVNTINEYEETDSDICSDIDKNSNNFEV